MLATCSLEAYYCRPVTAGSAEQRSPMRRPIDTGWMPQLHELAQDCAANHSL